MTDQGNCRAVLVPEALPAPSLFDDEITAARDYAAASRAASTRRVYSADWRRFTAWCAARQAEPRPADSVVVVAVFLAAEAEAGSKPATVGRRLAAIGHHHRAAAFEPPQARAGAEAIRDVLAGIRRTRGVKPVRKQGADGDAMRDILRAITGDSPRALRDRALLAIGMAAALRRSELVALTLAMSRLSPKGCA